MVKPVTMTINEESRSILKLRTNGDMNISNVTMEYGQQRKRLIQSNDWSYDLTYNCIEDNVKEKVTVSVQSQDLDGPIRF